MNFRPQWHTNGKSGVRNRKPVTVVKQGRFGLDQPQRTDVKSVDLTLPMPPSTNALFANASEGGRVKTKAYNDWIEEAGWLLLGQRPGRIEGKYEMDIRFARPRTKRKLDLGNREKALSDLLVKHRVISDDSDAEKISLSWSDDLEGVRVIIRRAS